MNKKIRFKNWLKTNKQTKEGKQKQTIQGENNIFYKSITISSQYLNKSYSWTWTQVNYSRKMTCDWQKLMLSYLLQNVQVVSKKKTTTKTHKQTR